MKLLIAFGVVLFSIVVASSEQGVPTTATASSQSAVVHGTENQGPEPRDDHGGHHHYHYSHGQELFAGDEWLLAVPLLLIPLIGIACWWFWGGSGKDDGYGWDRMGYSENNNYTPGAYESRMLRGADALDKRTHQRIFNAIQQ